MAHYTPVAPAFLPPIFLARRRVIIACAHCRKRKIRCITPEDPPQNPCGRCTKKGLKCEYITMADQKEGTSTNKTAVREAASRRSSSSSPPARSRRGSSANHPGAHWNGPSRNDTSAAQPFGHSPPPLSADRYLPYPNQSSGFADEYNPVYHKANFPTLYFPYLCPARDVAPIFGAYANEPVCYDARRGLPGCSNGQGMYIITTGS
ncbi:hypothetical protein DFH08DRAFT_822461 [Mycena albidolilacea]|uniref:Zn(2)-C6 fungal-type domain-containing protein n=1 Tax=Mycena albidolilacea TaxID=1033008 RepID=A0AAD6Z7Z8_9AGAR|nr:hypothetical protein DFH08DRAFT_822461 [Mycena albidolilacea]